MGTYGKIPKWVYATPRANAFCLVDTDLSIMTMFETPVVANSPADIILFA